MKRIAAAVISAAALLITFTVPASAGTPPMPRPVTGGGWPKAACNGCGLLVTDGGPDATYAISADGHNNALITTDTNVSEWQPVGGRDYLIDGTERPTFQILLTGSASQCINWYPAGNWLSEDSCSDNDPNEYFWWKSDGTDYWLINVAASNDENQWMYATSANLSNGQEKAQFCDGCNVAQFVAGYGDYAIWLFQAPGT